MNERQLRRIQKHRHMSEILIMVLNNQLFKNLSDKDRKKMAALIYKAEMIEMHVRDKKIIRINESFQDIIDAIGLSLGPNEDDDDDFFRGLGDDDGDDSNPNSKF